MPHMWKTVLYVETVNSIRSRSCALTPNFFSGLEQMWVFFSIQRSDLMSKWRLAGTFNDSPCSVSGWLTPRHVGGGTGEHTFPGQLAAQGGGEPAAASVTLAELKQTEKDLERQRAAGSGSQRAGEHNVVMHDYISQRTVPAWRPDRKTHLYALVCLFFFTTDRAICASAKWLLYSPPTMLMLSQGSLLSNDKKIVVIISLTPFSGWHTRSFIFYCCLLFLSATSWLHKSLCNTCLGYRTFVEE